jgi:hypothetical protein
MGADEEGTLAAVKTIRRDLLDPTVAYCVRQISANWAR